MSRQSRRLRWGLPEPPTPKHPYRDTVLVYGCMAIGVVLFAWATGGHVLKAVVIAFAVWIAASVWSIARWHQRLKRRPPEGDA